MHLGMSLKDLDEQVHLSVNYLQYTHFVLDFEDKLN